MDIGKEMPDLGVTCQKRQHVPTQLGKDPEGFLINANGLSAVCASVAMFSSWSISRAQWTGMREDTQASLFSHSSLPLRWDDIIPAFCPHLPRTLNSRSFQILKGGCPDTTLHDG